MDKRILVLAAFASLFLAGCPTTNLYPLYNAKDSDTEPALVGSWVNKDETTAQGNAKIEKDTGNNNSYTMTITDPVEGATDIYDMHLVRLGGNLFADLMFDNRRRTDAKDGTKSSTDTEDMPMGMMPLHMVMKMEVKGDDLAMYTMEDDPLKKKNATAAPLLAYLDMDGNGILVTAGTEALRKYVAAHAVDGFSDASHLQRVH